MITNTEYKTFQDADYTVLPMCREIMAPGESPLSLYAKIANQQNNFLFESVEGGDRWAQYSIIGFGCIDTIKISGKKIETIIDGSRDIFEAENPLQAIEEIISKNRSPKIENLPRFHGGYIGFFAYESAQYAEKKIALLSGKESKFEEHMPDIMLVKADQLIIFDNLNNSTQIIFNANLAKMTYEFAQSKLDDIETMLTRKAKIEAKEFKPITNCFEFESNFTKEGYCDAVNTIKNYIAEGDVMQVVLAQDFSATFDKDPFDLYKAIRELNPSPYMYFLDLDECQIVGASPEILVRLEDNEINLRPLAGTRKRGENPTEDKFNEDDFDGCDELLQMALSAQFVIKGAGENLQPHLIVYYLRDISQSFHQFYNSVNILNAKESEQSNIIRSLIIVKSVIASSLELLGIEPLDSM